MAGKKRRKHQRKQGRKGGNMNSRKYANMAGRTHEGYIQGKKDTWKEGRKEK